MNDIDTLRDSIARITQRGVGMPMAGTLYWLAMAFVGARFAPANAAAIFFFATGAVFPLGLMLTRVLGGDLFAKGHPLTGLGGLLNAVQAFYWPVVIAVYRLEPTLVPFVLATLFVSHFLPYGWFYRSRGYTLLGIAGPALAILLQLADPARAFVSIPLGMGLVYALAVTMVMAENRRDFRPAAA